MVAGQERFFSESDSHFIAVAQGLVAVVMTFGVFNRILYKMALVPLGDYIFFLAQFQTFR